MDDRPDFSWQTFDQPEILVLQVGTYLSGKRQSILLPDLGRSRCFLAPADHLKSYLQSKFHCKN